MSAKRKRKEAPMPATMAGLLAFFEEESKGIKIRPELTIIIAIILIVGVIVLSRLFPF